jgi:hypothetical protein
VVSEEVDRYDVEAMIRDALHEIRREICTATREAVSDLRLEREAEVDLLRSRVDVLAAAIDAWMKARS